MNTAEDLVQHVGMIGIVYRESCYFHKFQRYQFMMKIIKMTESGLLVQWGC